MDKKHDKKKRILAIIGIVLLVGLYASTLVFALIKTELAQDLLKVSIACTIIIPILLYSYILVYRLLDKRKEEPQEK